MKFLYSLKNKHESATMLETKTTDKRYTRLQEAFSSPKCCRSPASESEEQGRRHWEIASALNTLPSTHEHTTGLVRQPSANSEKQISSVVKDSFFYSRPKLPELSGNMASHTSCLPQQQFPFCCIFSAEPACLP